MLQNSYSSPCCNLMRAGPTNNRSFVYNSTRSISILQLKILYRICNRESNHPYLSLNEFLNFLLQGAAIHHSINPLHVIPIAYKNQTKQNPTTKHNNLFLQLQRKKQKEVQIDIKEREGR